MNPDPLYVLTLTACLTLAEHSPAQRRGRDADAVELDVQLAQGGGESRDLLLVVQRPEDAQATLHVTSKQRVRYWVAEVSGDQRIKRSYSAAVTSGRPHRLWSAEDANASLQRRARLYSPLQTC